MSELKKHGQIGKAALRAAMDRKTARRYRDAKRLPSELKTPRSYKTRKDPFEKDWVYLLERLKDAPELEAKTLFEHLEGHARLVFCAADDQRCFDGGDILR